MSITIHHDKNKPKVSTVKDIPFGEAFTTQSGRIYISLHADKFNNSIHCHSLGDSKSTTLSPSYPAEPVDLHVYVGDEPAPYVDSAPSLDQIRQQRDTAIEEMRAMRVERDRALEQHSPSQYKRLVTERDNAVAHQERAQRTRDEAMAYTDVIEDKLKAERAKCRKLRKQLKGGK